jgi:hypothetical protein
MPQRDVTKPKKEAAMPDANPPATADAAAAIDPAAVPEFRKPIEFVNAGHWSWSVYLLAARAPGWWKVAGWNGDALFIVAMSRNVERLRQALAARGFERRSGRLDEARHKGVEEHQRPGEAPAKGGGR